jgi:hypothetical protein
MGLGTGAAYRNRTDDLFITRRPLAGIGQYPLMHSPAKAGSRSAGNLAAVRWSRGLRAAIIGPAVAPERTDLELAADDTNGELVTGFPAALWSAIRRAGLDLAILAAAENGGHPAMRSVMAALASLT